MYAAPVLLALSLLSVAQAHMHLHHPPTLKGDNNPYTQGQPDQFLNYPYGCCGREVPGACKGHLDLLDTEEGTPVVTWNAGAKVNFTLSGASIQNTPDQVKGGTHYGGSCQVGFSTDKGKTFKVATTWNGNCPLRNGGEDPSGQSFDFVVPADMPSGNAVFAWTWVNREQEFNMNCASVTISGNGTPDPENPPSTPSAVPPSIPTKTKEAYAPEETGSNSQYTLDGCTCYCPAKTWTEACSCECPSNTRKSRQLVERKALALHRRHLDRSTQVDSHQRRATAWTSRPNMEMYDFDGAACTSPGNPFELKYANSEGGDVVEGDGEYQLQEGSCS
ncbi:lytic polysaccharide monooxygenase [Amniculicola lignicola CBS 123094]|uniref:Lytic polysaccharide monooxygenase n=1 Tax=Amniculicola lignicola CBS 123094 TaxID=1392246 RepID=A0A6A5VSV6_9PLEO|nr:lytic polysaccharide monooxygenase [Amniculicola lignicola CBS 123094]